MRENSQKYKLTCQTCTHKDRSVERVVWEDLGMRETLGQVMKEEKNVVWLKWNENIWGRNFTDARMNMVRAPNLGSSARHTNQVFAEHLCHRHHFRHSSYVISGKSHPTELQIVVPILQMSKTEP